MCGFIGFNWGDSESEEVLENALGKIRHRGPDSSKLYAENIISLGFARLAINDLTEDADQPIENEDGSIVLAFNGEIYNFQELRRELRNKGHKFKSESDSEVIVHAYEEEGIDCVKRFNGMWAFALYDKQQDMLFLSRDRFGIKPLYYYYEDGAIIFSSEPKAIIEVLSNYEEPIEVNKESLDIYLSLGYIPEPYSIYSKIHKLKKAHNMFFSLNTGQFTEQRYWQLPTPKYYNDEKEIISYGRSILREIIREMKIADVPVGTFLSGGIDSTTVTALVNEQKKGDLHTFSIGFIDKNYDESKYSEIAAKGFKTKHHHYTFKQKDFENLLNRIYYYYDEPFADYSMFPTYMVSKLAKKYVTVCLSGDGGDELFGGYDSYRKFKQIKMFKYIPFKFLLKRFGSEKLSRAIKMYSSKDSEDWIINYLSIGGQANQLSSETEQLIKDISKGEGPLTALMKYDFNYVLTDDYLVKVDRASMANSLEVRVPLLDHRFVEFANNIPVKLKTDLFKGKKIFKKIVRGIIPDDCIDRKKMGFGSPIVRWMFTTYKDLCIEKLEKLKERKLVDNNKIDKYIYYLNKSKYNGLIGITTFRYVGLELWCERWLG
jgi:asparagine synthase (glutamine-hydrolysing)